MPEDAAYQRYLLFKDASFGDAPTDIWAKCYQSLVPLERGLVYRDAIGEVTEFEYVFEVNYPTPIREKPISYKKVERQWVREYQEPVRPGYSGRKKTGGEGAHLCGKLHPGQGEAIGIVLPPLCKFGKG